MFKILSGVWAPLVGMVFVMLGNGMHFTLIGLRADLEAFSGGDIALVTSGYFVGFLSGARLAPALIRRVGHAKVFAALASMMSAGLIAFELQPDPGVWTMLRLALGFCMSGLYVTTESWLNEASQNHVRGKVLSVYMVGHTLGIMGAQALVGQGDAGSARPFITASIFVSLAVVPILLSSNPAPPARITTPMTLSRLFEVSPLGATGVFLLGALFAVQGGMGAIFGAQIGMSPQQIALFVALLFSGPLLLQYPIGALSDWMDRRSVLLVTALLGVAASGLGLSSGGWLPVLWVAAFLTGGLSTPLYAVCVAQTNDKLSVEEMPAASGGLIFVFGLGAILGPMVAGGALQSTGPQGFWLASAALFAGIAVFTIFRMAQVPDEESSAGAPGIPAPGAFRPKPDARDGVRPERD